VAARLQGILARERMAAAIGQRERIVRRQYHARIGLHQFRHFLVREFAGERCPH
jgi:hypothetical protein